MPASWLRRRRLGRLALSVVGGRVLVGRDVVERDLRPNLGLRKPERRLHRPLSETASRVRVRLAPLTNRAIVGRKRRAGKARGQCSLSSAVTMSRPSAAFTTAITKVHRRENLPRRAATIPRMNSNSTLTFPRIVV